MSTPQTFTGDTAQAGIYGNVKVWITVKDGKITDAGAADYPKIGASGTISQTCIPQYRQSTIDSNGKQVATCTTNATHTQEAWQTSLASALLKAGIK